MTDLDALERLAKGATQGEWESMREGEQHDETCYQCIRAGGRVLFDTCNSDAMEIRYDEGGYWDETGKRNLNFVAAANPQTILTLIAQLRVANDRIAELEKTCQR